ncbi:hypothetical protein HanIR_Chr02g0057821 [Helianthus annuus]|nr:hypothetical protein HanIR_Chr02g0057821 [Helianthus annuus]
MVHLVIQLRLFVYCYSYSVIITTDVFIYSLYQLFKGIFDIANKGILISDKRSINSKNYIVFLV